MVEVSEHWMRENERRIADHEERLRSQERQSVSQAEHSVLEAQVAGIANRLSTVEARTQLGMWVAPILISVISLAIALLRNAT